MAKAEILHNPAGKEICGAKTKRGTVCQSVILSENGRCRVHGGKTPRGAASPHYQGKGRSRYLPERLQDRYNEAMRDKDLLSTRADLSEIEARLDELAKQLDTGESGAAWAALGGACDELTKAQASGDEGKTTAAIASIIRLVQRGNGEYAIWGERLELWDVRRKLIDTETKREQRGTQMISAARVVTMLQDVAISMQEAVLTYVGEDDKLARNILFEARRRLAGFLRRSSDTRDLPPGTA